MHSSMEHAVQLVASCCNSEYIPALSTRSVGTAEVRAASAPLSLASYPLQSAAEAQCLSP